MNKPALIAAIAETGDITKTAASEILDIVFDAFTDLLIKGEEINVPGFGKFAAKLHEPRTGRDPSTGEMKTFPAKTRVKFSPSSVLKDAVNQ